MDRSLKARATIKLKSTPFSRASTEGAPPELLLYTQRKSYGDAANTSSLVAVYAALLGFFIALNALSEPAQERRDQALNSLRQSFSDYSEDAAPPTMGEMPDETWLNAGQQAMALLAEAFSAPLSHGARNEVLQIGLPMAALFAPGDAELRADRAPVLSEIVTMIVKSGDWDVELGLADVSEGLARRRLLDLADRLQSMGLPQSRLALVIEARGGAGAEETVLLRLRTRREGA